MNPFWLIPISLALDLSLGDPQGFPHPVRLMGKFARYLERISRLAIPSPFLAGCVTSLIVYSASFFLPWSLLQLSSEIHPFLEYTLSIFIIYTSVALKDLLDHSKEVYHALAEGNVEMAREKVGKIVGRDTGSLSEEEIVRATVESVGENLVDGITAPLFFAAIGGPALAILYRSINTLDSLFGYKNETYIRFGWVPAKVDDLANYIPARITAPLLSIASGLLGFHSLLSLHILRRDGRKNPSPNSGLSEAALAGALNIQLGGRNYYQGVLSEKPKIGEANENLTPQKILDANKIVLFASILTAFFYLIAVKAFTLLLNYLQSANFFSI
ncbi:cobalamin biosynthesis protein CobD [Leptospira langatensis]|uniref:Cobalamin biosynthesis protein CobD n=1 Tax=Leptospira langatensis TaxID=2484983 RepID=A0A5F1ZXC5_9LEPT|nr:adenosylcobinamide-phosphate synthase CbiB [Leptospira langatensis]TGJ98423.1 cobalamin biosynthesis protein CobD [Leptospira langatensis]TGL43338.1 cobalamin biosynthesis protein CobD [Leptospira langatensis]